MTGLRLIASTLLLLVASPTILASEQDAELARAEALYRTEGPAAALPEFDRLLGEYEAAEDHIGSAIVRRFVGECHWRLGHFDESRQYLDGAVALSDQHGDLLNKAKALNVLGLLEWDLGNFESAIARFEDASAIVRELGDPRLEGAILNNASLVYDELGHYDASLDRYRKVLEIYSHVDFPRGEGDTLGNIGGVYLVLGRYAEAIEYYSRSLAISERLRSIPAMSQDHGNLGLSYAGLGQTERALEHFQRALTLAEQAGMRQEQGYWLRGMGNAQIRAGRYGKGLESHRAALAIYREDGADALLIDALNEMGQTLLALGDPASAERHFGEAIELARSIGTVRGIAINQLALGDLQYRHQRLEAAAALYAQALEQARESGMRQLEAQALIKQSSVWSDQGIEGTPAEAAGMALGIARKIQARPLESSALLRLAEIERKADQHNEALQNYHAAAEIADELADPDLQWRIEYGRALAYAAKGDRGQAIASLRSAVEHIESVRGQLREDRFRTGYLQDKQQVYVELVRLLLESGETDAAFFTAERLRSWVHIEQTGSRVRSELSEAEQASESALRERIRQLQRLLDEESSLPVPEQRQRAVAVYSRELMLAESQYQTFLDDKRASIGNGTQLGPEAATRARTALGEKEALVEYIVGTNHVMVFVLRPGWIRARTVPLSRIDLHSRLELLRDLLEQRDHQRWARPAARLADALTEPLRQAGWLDGVDHLYLVPHGMLNYMPFILLPIGPAPDGELLIERFSVSYLPMATLLGDGAGVTGTPRSMLALAPASSRLRHAPQEAISLGSLFSPHAKTLTGAAATETAFREEAAGYRFLHLATHGYFNKLNPLLSGLELEADASNDGLLEVHEILLLRLNAELVALSACQTGLGSGFFAEIPAGDDFVGMTRAFLQAGSASVLATLWEVNDRSTVDLMTRFYSRLEEMGANGDKAVALADAQRALLASDQYHHPYFWAPFILIGPLHDQEEVRG